MADNALTRKIGPLPTWVWVAIAAAAVLLYAVLKGKSSTAAKGKGKGAGADTMNSAYLVPPYIWTYQNFPPHTGGGGSGGKGGGGGKGKTPPEHHNKHKDTGKHRNKNRQITVDKDETLEQLAKYDHWSKGTLAQVEKMNKVQGGGELTPSTKLHKGQTIERPLKKI